MIDERDVYDLERKVRDLESALGADSGVTATQTAQRVPSTGGPASLAVHFSSNSVEWATPSWLFDALHAEFGFTLDPCSTDENAKCKRHFTIKEDGLTQDWGSEIVFMNPPYGREIGHWMRKAFESAQRGATVVCLIPARTDTAWWHRYAMKGDIRFMRGRVRFQGAENGAPFPSAVVIFRPPEYRLGILASEHGTAER